jgi:hypothetical protein
MAQDVRFKLKERIAKLAEAIRKEQEEASDKTEWDLQISQHVPKLLKLTTEYPVQTPYDVVQVIYVGHCHLAIALSKCTSQKYHITVYNCTMKIISQDIQLDGSFICANEIEYHPEKAIFAIPYCDAGSFFVMIFNEFRVLLHQSLENEVAIDSDLVLNSNFFAPLINCFFLEDSSLFINLLNY